MVMTSLQAKKTAANGGEKRSLLGMSFCPIDKSIDIDKKYNYII